VNSYWKKEICFISAASPEPFWVQGAYVSEAEVETW